MAYTVEKCDEMYRKWRQSGSGMTFEAYWDLDFHALAEIAHIYALARENKSS